jgi:periplasmic protein TonB
MNTRLKFLASIALVIVGGCKNGDGSSLPFQTVGRQPDIPPVMLNKELPFRYPPALYAQKVQGNVTLRIFIDRDGAIVADSTRIAETSGFTALDSAAMKGSRDLKFEPAKTQGQSVPVSILLPVFFRHPDAPPLAGDSIIPRDSSTTSTTVAPPDTVKTDTPTVSATKTAAKKAPVRKAATKRKTTR